jgi:hypothetical protein
MGCAAIQLIPRLFVYAGAARELRGKRRKESVPFALSPGTDRE